MYILYISFTVNTLILLFMLFLIRHKTYKTAEEILAQVSEALITVVLAGFCIIVSYFLLFAKALEPSVSGSDINSYLLIGGFSLAGTLMGSYGLLYTYVKKYMILSDRLLKVNVIGISRSFYWREITSVRVPLLSKNLVVRTEHGTCSIHSGNLKQYKNFILILKQHIPADSGASTVSELYNSL